MCPLLRPSPPHYQSAHLQHRQCVKHVHLAIVNTAQPHGSPTAPSVRAQPNGSPTAPSVHESTQHSLTDHLQHRRCVKHSHVYTAHPNGSPTAPSVREARKTPHNQTNHLQHRRYGKLQPNCRDNCTAAPPSRWAHNLLRSETQQEAAIQLSITKVACPSDITPKPYILPTANPTYISSSSTCHSHNPTCSTCQTETAAHDRTCHRQHVSRLSIFNTPDNACHENNIRKQPHIAHTT